MLIWLVGKEGMLGKALLHLLQKSSFSFIASSKKEADLTSLKSLQSFVQTTPVTHIINAAAYTNVRAAEDEKTKAFQVNCQGVENLAILAGEKKAKLIQISTDYVFDGKKTSPYLEDDLTCPLNVYGQSKLAAEKIIQEKLQDFVLIRTSWLFSEEGNNFVFKMLDLMHQEKELRVVHDQLGRPTFVGDLAEAILRLLDFSGVFHFAGKEIVSWYQFTMDIWLEAKRQKAELTVEKIKPVLSCDFKSGVQRPLFSVLDLQKLKKLLSIKAPSYKIALKNTVSGYLKSLKLSHAK